MGSEVDILASYLPRFVIERMIREPQATVEPRSETIPATVFFADIAGFTAVAEQLAAQPDGAEELRRRLNRYFGRLIDVIVNVHGGDVVKFAGDALLAIWRTTDDALVATTLAAVNCGLQIQSELAADTHGEQLSLKINIATGPLRMLEVGGVFGRWDWTICGEPLVEIASNPRAEPDQVVMAQPTWQLVKNHCRGRKHSKTTVRVDRNMKPATPTPHEELRVSENAMANLRSYIPVAVLSRIHVGQDAWISELRRVTVLFINLPGLDHETSLEKSQTAARSLQQAIYRFEGSVNKFSVDEKGTTLVAVFGLPPLTHSDDAVRGVRSAMAIHKTLGELDFAHSIGVCTGRVFCGSLGNETRREYTVLGDVVNLTARLMQAAKGTILSDHETWEQSHERIEFETLEPVTVKGKSQPVPVYAPRQEKSCTVSGASPLVGREVVRQQLECAIEAFVATTAPNVLVVIGDAGIGKSHLIHSVLARQGGLQRLIGNADATEIATPYFLWRSIFRQLFDLEQYSDAQQRTQHVRAQVSPDEWCSQRLPLLNPIVSIEAAETDITAQMTGDVRADNTRELLLRILELAARQQNIVIALEDAHWFDSASWAMLNGIRRRSIPVLLLLATRSENESSSSEDEFQQFLADESVQSVLLGELSRKDIDLLICDCLGAEQLSPEVSAWIFDRTGGHPYFARELALAMRESSAVIVERGIIRRAEQAASLADLEIPDTLDGLINTRLDRLPPQEGMVLKSASVIGVEFARDLLQDIHPIAADRPEIPALLHSLQTKDLVRDVRDARESVWQFQHAMTREVAYRLLLFADRKRLHVAIARWYERRSVASADFPRLAFHWSHSDDNEKAYQYAALAGSFSLEQGAYREAREFLKNALGRFHVTSKSSIRIRREAASLERQLGEACLELGFLQESSEHLRKSLRLLGQPEPETAVGRAASVSRILSWQAARYFRLVGRKRSGTDEHLAAARTCGLLCEVYYLGNESLRFFHASLHMHMLAQKAGPSRELALADAINCLTAGTIPIRPLARTYMRRARKAERSLNDAHASARIMLMAAVHHVGHGEWDEARSALQDGLALCEQLDDYRNYGLLSVVFGASWYFTGRFHEALEIWTELHSRAVDRGDVLHEAWGNGGQALNCLRLGRLNEAVDRAEAALVMFEKNRDLISQATTSGVLTAALGRLGEHVEAEAAANETRRLLRQFVIPTSYYLLEAYAAVAEYDVDRFGQKVQSGESSRPALKRARQSIKWLGAYARLFPLGKPALHLLRGRLRQLKNHSAAATFHFQQSLREARRLGMDYHAALAEFELGRHGRGGPAMERLTSAIRMFGTMGTEYDLAQSQAVLDRFEGMSRVSTRS